MQLSQFSFIRGASVLLLWLPAASSPAQVNKEEKFSRVPADQRARFVERFRLFVDYEHKRQCEKLYDEMISPDMLEFRARQALDRDSYIEACRKSYELIGKEPPIELNVVKVRRWRYAVRNEVVYCVDVTEVFRRGGRTVEEKSTIWGRLSRGEWYFDHPDVQY